MVTILLLAGTYAGVHASIRLIGSAVASLGDLPRTNDDMVFF
ncbi:hypothetical protein [Caenimonas koreensis]